MGMDDSLPGEDVLGVVIPQVDLCRPTNGNALTFHVYNLEQMRLCDVRNKISRVVSLSSEKET